MPVAPVTNIRYAPIWEIFLKNDIFYAFPDTDRIIMSTWNQVPWNAA